MIEKTYLYDTEKENIIGYRIGATVLANVGITYNLENTIKIVTNNFNRRKVVDTIKQNIHLKKPIIQVNNDNFRYLQLLDTIKEIDKYHLTSDRVGEKIVYYMSKNNIKVDKWFKIAKEHYSKKTINKLVELLAM